MKQNKPNQSGKNSGEGYMPGISRFNYWEYLRTIGSPDLYSPDSPTSSLARIWDEEGNPLPSRLEGLIEQEEEYFDTLHSAVKQGKKPERVFEFARKSAYPFTAPWAVDRLLRWRRQNTVQSRRKIRKYIGRIINAWLTEQGRGQRMGTTLIKEIAEDIKFVRAVSNDLRNNKCTVESALYNWSGIGRQKQSSSHSTSATIRLRGYDLNRKIWRAYRRELLYRRWTAGPFWWNRPKRTNQNEIPPNERGNLDRSMKKEVTWRDADEMLRLCDESQGWLGWLQARMTYVTDLELAAPIVAATRSLKKLFTFKEDERIAILEEAAKAGIPIPDKLRDLAAEIYTFEGMAPPAWLFAIQYIDTESPEEKADKILDILAEARGIDKRTPKERAKLIKLLKKSERRFLNQSNERKTNPAGRAVRKH